MLSQRQLTIFKAIVDEFIRTAEPIGSKTLMNMFELPYSSATIRNEMAELEDLGLLEKTHTSSGRVPSSHGYRFYVDHLMEKKLDEESRNALQQVFMHRNVQVEDVIRHCCEIMSQMTNLTSVVLGPNADQQYLQHIKLFPISEHSAVAVFITSMGHTENKIFQFEDQVAIEDLQVCCDILNEKLCGTMIGGLLDKLNEVKPLLVAHVHRSEILFQAFVNAFIKFTNENVYFSGKNNMLYQPEFSDVEKIRRLMRAMENTSIWRKLDTNKSGVTIQIGKQTEILDMDDVSVVSSKFRLRNNEEGQFMVVGPTRMAYDKIVAMMEYMTDNIESLFHDSEGENENE